MKDLLFGFATDDERDKIAEMFANSEPWISLGLTLDTCKAFCHDPEYILFVARLQNKLAGSIVAHCRGVASSPYFKSVIVAKEYRGLGIGALLVKYAEDYFRKGSKHLFLCVSSFNKDAQKFYEKIGYSKVGEFKDYILEGESELLMYKRLK